MRRSPNEYLIEMTIKAMRQMNLRPGVRDPITLSKIAGRKLMGLISFAIALDPEG